MSDDQVKEGKSGKEVLEETHPFAMESPVRSWWAVISTVSLLFATLVLAGVAPWWPARLALSLLGALLLVRTFILYHDYLHRSLLRKSRLARPLFHVFGMITLTPPRYWRFSHNFHHGNVGKPVESEDGDQLLFTSDLGSFPLMTVEKWKTATWRERFHYRLARHPLTLLMAYLTIFLFSITILPLLKSPKRYWDGALALVMHGALVAGLWLLFGFDVLFFSFLLPYACSAAIGAYLFYAQHNYEGLHVLEPEEWSYYRGSIESSSFMDLGRIMHWFTGNIGYHHVHHLNPLIPFYRLPEAMAAVPELQLPKKTTLLPHDIFRCLRLNLWDTERGELVTFQAARRAT
ncbi:MAG: fatty acid desaturase [Phycisphaeraceae bacterium]|nr:fatty acid desaturase [Phycisphaeraceae bacterium]